MEPGEGEPWSAMLVLSNQVHSYQVAELQCLRCCMTNERRGQQIKVIFNLRTVTSFHGQLFRTM